MLLHTVFAFLKIDIHHCSLKSISNGVLNNISTNAKVQQIVVNTATKNEAAATIRSSANSSNLDNQVDDKSGHNLSSIIASPQANFKCKFFSKSFLKVQVMNRHISTHYKNIKEPQMIINDKFISENELGFLNYTLKTELDLMYFQRYFDKPEYSN